MTRDYRAIYARRKARAEAEGTTVYAKRQETPVNDPHDELTDEEWTAFADATGIDQGTSAADLEPQVQAVLDLAIANLPAPEPVFGTTVLAIPDGITIDQWAALGGQLRTALNSTPWWVGDWLLYAHTHYETDPDGNARSAGAGEVRRRLVEMGYEADTTVDYLRVADRFRPSTRHEDLSWKHHRTVAPLSSSDAHRLLNEASVEGWTTKELQERVNRLRAIDTTGQETLPGMGKPMRLTVRFGAGVISDPQTLERAATRIGEVLEELGLDGEVKVA